MLIFFLVGCEILLDLLSTDERIDATCQGTDTVVIDGRDICKEWENTGHVDCDVGYKIVLDGTTVCPAPPLSGPPKR